MSEQRLRTALRELGDVPPPTDLASGALARARRDRRRTVVALAVAAAVVAAVAVTVPTVLLRRPDQPPAAPTPSPTVWVPSFQVMVGAPGGGTGLESLSYVVDPARRGYRTVPGVSVQSVSPDGRQAVVRHAGTGVQVVMPVPRLAAGVTAADRARPLPPRGLWRWSPDSTRLLTVQQQSRDSVDAVVVDLRTREVTRTPLRADDLRIDPLALDWGPGGRGFVVWASSRLSGPPAPSQLVFFDGSGRPERRRPFPAAGPVDPGSSLRVAVSPEGGQALLTNPTSFDAEGARGRSWVVDLGTGDARHLSVPHDQWYDERHLVRVDMAGPEPSSLVVVDVVTREVVRRTTLPPVPRALMIQGFELARGAAPPGAVVL